MTEKQRLIPRFRAIPFFIPGWLYFPMLWYGIRFLPRTMNENVLALVLQIPALLSLVILFPLWKRWTTAREVFLYLLLPNTLLGLMWVSTLSD